ncbi:MAG: ribosome recycling factor [Patescibacteria group bacterium]
MYSAYIISKKSEFQKILEHLGQELSTVRTGRASPALVEGIQVNVYATMMELKSIASISVPDARTLQIQPWDKANLQPIEHAIATANLGINPVNDGTVIRLVMPQLTEETRKQMVKMMKEKLEVARVAIRKMRERVRDEIVASEKAREIAEDERFARQEELDKIVKEFDGDISASGEKKEKEIMTV